MVEEGGRGGGGGEAVVGEEGEWGKEEDRRRRKWTLKFIQPSPEVLETCSTLNLEQSNPDP